MTARSKNEESPGGKNIDYQYLCPSSTINKTNNGLNSIEIV
jgi:hypothetical protein